MARNRFTKRNLVSRKVLFIRHFLIGRRPITKRNSGEFRAMRRISATLMMALILNFGFAPLVSAQVSKITASSVKAIELTQVQSPLRVVALANGSAEVVAALGLRSVLVGRDIASSSDEFKKIPIVTSGHQVIAEKVISLKPDLVLIDANVGPKSAIDTIKSAKIRVVTISQAWKLNEVYQKVSQISEALDIQKSGLKLNAKLKGAASLANSYIGWRPKVAFLYLRGPSSIYLIGGPGSGADSLISALGGVDVGAKTLKNPFNTLTSEALVKADPDVILVMSKGLQSVGGLSGLLKLPGVAQTKAGKSKKILSVDDSLLLSFGPRTPALLGEMAKALKVLK